MAPLLISCFFLTVCLSIQTLKGQESSSCPNDCICYTEHLFQLETWKWIDENIHLDPEEDFEHYDFNPYTEHNEVIDNPSMVKKLQSSKQLNTVTCILRSPTTGGIKKQLNQLPSSTQILSLLQAPGTGNITIEQHYFNTIPNLIGLEIEGYKDLHGESGNDIVSIAADALSALRKLTYLSLVGVTVKQRDIPVDSMMKTRNLVAANYTIDGPDKVKSIFVLVENENDDEDSNIVPYNVYKQTEKSEKNKKKRTPENPKVRAAFTGLSSLVHLRLSRCIMDDISWDLFYKLDNLKYLLLTYNNLLFLPDYVFYATPNLTALSLSGNRILSLQTVGLVGLLNLQKLDLTYNNITHLSELSLPPFPNLTIADFRFNPIETVFPNTFEVMNTTKTLFLGNPTIPLQISPNSFFGLTSLTKLDILNIRIGFLERPMLKGMPELQALVLQGSISRISYDAFSEVPKLERLILRHCGIQKVSMDAFYSLHSLIELDLSFNKLTFIPPGILDDQVSLREIRLEHNELTTLPSDLFAKIPVKMIRLENNPWHCSCDMKSWDQFLINKVKRHHVPKNDTFCQRQYDKGSLCHLMNPLQFQIKYVYEKRVSPLCQSPKKFAKRSIFDIQRKHLLHCNNTGLTKLTSSNSLQDSKMAILNMTMSKEMLKKILFPEKPIKIRKPVKQMELKSSTITQGTVQSTTVAIAATVKTTATPMVTKVTRSLTTQEPETNYESTIILPHYSSTTKPDSSEEQKLPIASTTKEPQELSVSTGVNHQVSEMKQSTNAPNSEVSHIDTTPADSELTTEIDNNIITEKPESRSLLSRLKAKFSMMKPTKTTTKEPPTGNNIPLANNNIQLSKKSMKLARMQKMQKMQTRQRV